MDDPYSPSTKYAAYPNAYAVSKAAKLGLWLFLATLSIFFAGSLVAFVIVQTNHHRGLPGLNHLPYALWVSTAVLLVQGALLSLALRNIRRERQAKFRQWLNISFVLGLLFIVIQTPALSALLAAHSQFATKGAPLYGMMFVLVAVHALHVFAGIIPLGIVVRRAAQGRYDHERYEGVQMCVLYWHFLEVVWIILFATILIAN